MYHSSIVQLKNNSYLMWGRFRVFNENRIESNFDHVLKSGSNEKYIHGSECLLRWSLYITQREQGLPWAADSYSAAQDTAYFYGSLRFNIVLHNPPTDTNLSHINPVHISTAYLSDNYIKSINFVANIFIWRVLNVIGKGKVTPVLFN
jgi:hypothetical protein